MTDENEMKNNMRQLAWDTYFAGLMSISMHPGAGKDIGYGPHKQSSVEECALIADAMLIERDKRLGDK